MLKLDLTLFGADCHLLYAKKVGFSSDFRSNLSLLLSKTLSLPLSVGTVNNVLVVENVLVVVNVLVVENVLVLENVLVVDFL